MICENCGTLIETVLMSVFQYDGSDRDIEHEIEDSQDEDAVVIETTQNWTGYELTEDEMMDRIRCPFCKKFPFKHREVQVYDVVRIVCFKEAK